MIGDEFRPGDVVDVHVSCSICATVSGEIHVVRATVDPVPEMYFADGGLLDVTLLERPCVHFTASLSRLASLSDVRSVDAVTLLGELA